ncbi:MAG: zinc-binding alcohol dehydrogenase family protein [Gemmatimonadetes bacterium]|jgi:2-desacetyl-2-hydroxyethyl bacteriochlorophyllide A dehydrogenase|nr:zinc-binding alcohol dehydrogenase family protein [Gemmatimonadota bacterium]MBT7863954.1 zinc-binding alcohol dehydrogenase family protein [Gemmatimonadota bacterium]
MKTLILAEPGRFERADTTEPDAPAAGHATLRIHRVGICGTDLHAFRGRQPFFEYPRILGHELGAEIVALGDGVDDLCVGDHVAVEPYMECGTCQACRAGTYNCCQSLQVLGVHTDGGMREFIDVPARKLFRSNTLDLEQLALVETLGIGAHAVERAQLGSGETVLVVGAGPIGLATAQFAALAGTRVHMIELDGGRRDFALGHFDIAGARAPGDDAETTLADLREHLDGDLPTCVFDCTGSRASMETSLSFPASAGRLVFVGFQLETISFANPEFHRRELSLLASRNSTSAQFRRILALMECGDVDTTPWITHRTDFEAVVEEFPSWLEPQTGVVKAMLSF